MGKSGRHKKLSRQEKSKTHLKGGVKKLAKAQNVVNPTLAVKRIVIREQLGSSSEADTSSTTRRKQNIQEILSLLHHHNVNLKKDALGGLMELVTRSPSVLKAHLEKILERIACLTADLEGSVRKENLRVAEAIFAIVDEKELTPFWDLLLTHIKFSLTHLNSSVKTGTLPFFRLLIGRYPRLVASSSELVLSSLLSLITSDDSGGGESKKKKSVLKVDVHSSGKQDQYHERLQVFSLIDSTLQLNADEVEGEVAPAPQVSFEESLSIPLLYPHPYDGLMMMRTKQSESLNSILASNSSSKPETQDGNSFWPRFCQSTTSCLVETWIEVSSSHSDTNSPLSQQRSDIRSSSQPQPGSASSSSSYLTTHAVESLKVLVSVLAQIVVKNEKNFLGFKFKFGDGIVKYFLSRLPYVAVREGDQKAVTTVNLRLFLAAAQSKLMDAELMTRMHKLTLDLIQSDSLDYQQCELVLKFLSVPEPFKKNHRHRPQNDLATTFVVSALSTKNLRRGVLKYLQAAVQPDNLRDVHLVNELDWDEVTLKLATCFSRISVKWLNVLSQIANRRLADVGEHLLRKTDWFLDQLPLDAPEALWKEAIRLFWYSDTLPHFIQAFDGNNVPQSVQVDIASLSSLTYCF